MNKRNKKCVIKGRLKFNDYNKGLLNNKIILKSQQRFKVEHIMCLQKKSIRLH